MFADLKEKAAGFDRKRFYTAAATVLIAGAAGHFMQRTDQAPSPNAPTLARSVPASASVVGAASTPTRSVPDGLAEVAASEMPAPAVTEEPFLAEVADDLAPVEMPTVVAQAPETKPLAPEPTGEDVTRGSATPIFDFDENPGPEKTAETGIAELEPAPTPEPEPEASAPNLFAALGDAAEPTTNITLEPIVEPTHEPEAAPALVPEVSCEISFNAEPQAGAMVALTFEAPCHSGEDVGFEHGDLRFSEQLGPDGSLMILVPVMTETVVFTARLDDGQNAAVETRVSDFASFERIAVVWKGATGLQLHALENGATYGEPGHVWAEQPGATEMATQGAGGFVSVLGSSADGYAADVYTYPAGLVVGDTGPDISIEAQVMENTCGTRIAGTILRSNAVGAPNVEKLSMAVPGCDAVGEYLVLKNLPQELKLAGN